jgi:hypothetical protein
LRRTEDTLTFTGSTDTREQFRDRGGPLTRFKWIFIVAATLIPVSQQIPTRTLSTPELEYPEPFSDVADVRELRNGTVIVVDSRERIIHAVDMKRATATRIGREGPGPGEYRIPLRVLALPGDSSVVYDMGNSGHPLVITPDARAGGALAAREGSPMLFQTSAIDAAGRVFTEVRADGRLRTDSAAIERYDRATGRRDTLARVSVLLVSPLSRRTGRGRGAPTGGGAPAAASRGAVPPFASHDQWAVAADGRIAVVSVEPYQVTFTDAGGRKTRGPVIDLTPIRVNDALKEVWRTERRRPIPSLAFSNGQMTAQSIVPRYEEPAEWPEHLPAFLDRAVAFAPNGMLWVKRAVAADSPPTVDIIDPTGRVVQRVVLPRQTRLVGFGANSLYLVRIDPDDLLYLQRYSLPPKP